MPSSTLTQQLVQTLAQTPNAGGLLLALSGGCDSIALLHCAHQYALAQKVAIRAVHVNHQLQAAAADFEKLCIEFCQHGDIPLVVHQVNVNLDDNASVEAAAREARYRVLAQELRPGETLLLAHHQNDQAETFLLQALRGAGVAGLAGMAKVQAWHHGYLARPWLDVKRNEIEEYVTRQQLRFIDDPSNFDTRLKRNALRQDVLPVLREHFPSYEKTLARVAQHCAEADQLLADLAELDAEHCVDRERGTMLLPSWRRLSLARQKNFLRYWLSQHDVQALNEARLNAIADALRLSDSHRTQLDWDHHSLRVYRDQVFLLPTLPMQSIWHVAGHQLIADEAVLTLSGISPTCVVRCGELPEKIAEAGERRKEFLQSLGVPEWLRAHIPAIYLDDELAFYGNIWRSPKMAAGIALAASGIWPSQWLRCRVVKPA